MKGKRVVGFAGIARPNDFKDMLINLGASPVVFKSFRDHYRFTARDLDLLQGVKKERAADLLITTEKDWVRMGEMAQDYPGLSFLRIEFSLLSEWEAFARWIKKCIEEKLGSHMN